MPVSRNGTVQSAVATTTATAPTMRPAARTNPLASPAALKMQNLIFPGMIALGCWGMAFSFAFLSNDSNHVLVGGMAAVMALLWSVNFGFRVRKIWVQRAANKTKFVSRGL
jgi:hypothetical protein